MNHRVGRILFAALVGLLIAVFSYRWITNPQGREDRVIEVSVVKASERHLALLIESETLEIVNPLMPNRKVGKVYVYPEDGENGDWSVSGFYRRCDDGRWHPFLMTLSADLELTSLKVKDMNPRFVERAKMNPLIELAN